MRRSCMSFLNEWFTSKRRKPLVIRGARQVGKTWIVRELAAQQEQKLIEINFEKQGHFSSYFSSNDPQQILLNLEAVFHEEIDPKKYILFLDEIQAAPDLLGKLRWFAEEMPELPVIAAGSLLEFVLEKPTFSMPVGRISYMYLEPLSFEEFLEAQGKHGLVKFIKAFQWANEVPIAIHESFMAAFKEYLFIGGMPEVVSSWAESRSLLEVSKVQKALVSSFEDDFSKYGERFNKDRLREVLYGVPRILGEKFVYRRINPDVQSVAIKDALHLLCLARVCWKVQGTAANGIPLKAEIKEKYFKVIFLDVGLCSALLGLSYDQLHLSDEIDLINSGGLAEQVAGQILRTIDPFFVEPELYCWQREEKGAEAEIDYVIQHHNKVIPVEVKAGSTGSLKSLHTFMGLKGYDKAVRINSDVPSVVNIEVKDYKGNPIRYKLLSLPFYLLGEVHRLLENS